MAFEAIAEPSRRTFEWRCRCRRYWWVFIRVEFFGKFCFSYYWCQDTVPQDHVDKPAYRSMLSQQKAFTSGSLLTVSSNITQRDKTSLRISARPEISILYIGSLTPGYNNSSWSRAALSCSALRTACIRRSWILPVMSVQRWHPCCIADSKALIVSWCVKVSDKAPWGGLTESCCRSWEFRAM